MGGTVAWLVAALSFVVEDAAIMRYRVDVRDNRHARRVRTQVIVVRRVTVALITAVAVGAWLQTVEPGALPRLRIDTRPVRATSRPGGGPLTR